MAFSHALAKSVLEDKFKGVAKDDKVWVMLHTAEPSAAGAGDEAVIGKDDIARKFVEMDEVAAASGDDEMEITNTAAVEWTGVQIDAAQALTHFSLWDAVTDGNFLACHTITDQPRTTGSDGVKFEIGALEVAIGVFKEPA